MTPRPKSVTFELDGGKAATAMIPVTGGTLTATGSDGSVFTLTIPDKALGGPEKVTMTPIHAVNGLPFSGGLIAGVHLEPDGLQLFQMATLTIKPAKSVPIENQVGVGFHGTGDNLYMQPLDPVAGISLHILHFSGAGVASGITGEIEEQAKNPPTDPADQAAQEIAAADNAELAAARKDAMLGTSTPADAAKVADSLKDTLGVWFDRVVEAKVASAEADYTLTDDALNAALGWERMVQLLGGQEAKYAAQSARLEAQATDLKKKFEKALADRCIVNHDLSAVLALAELERKVQMIGVGTSVEASPLDTVKECLRFELDFETIAPFVSNEAETYVLHDRVVKLVLEPDYPSGNLTASQPHEILGVTSVNPARVLKNPKSARNFTVTNLSFHIHFVLKRNAKSAPSITGVALTIDPGEVTAIRYDALSNTQIGSEGGVPAYQCLAWEMVDGSNACWGARHRDERSGATTFVIPLDYAGTSLFARATYDLPCTEYGQDCGGGNEKTTFDLRHVPAS
ncbi:MAG TPA: hypothetical protein VLU92_11665 [Candidatus Dormibacteraeota bacterium]|nr:hypothetical protein [Candidatus Dormibacteraeota bacterium]